MKRIRVMALAILFLAGGNVQPGRAAEEIIVGISTGYPPYYYKENGKYTGVCVELVNQVAESLGVEIHYREFPWKRLLANAEEGLVDAIMPLFRTKEREKYLYFNKLAIARETISFFVMKGQDINFDGTFTSLQGYTIGVVSGYSYGKKFDDYKGFNKVDTLNEEHLIEMFKHARFRVGVGNRNVILFFAQKMDLADELNFLSPHITDDLLYLGFSKNKENGDLHVQFSTALQSFKETEKYREIMNKYNIR